MFKLFELPSNYDELVMQIKIASNKTPSLEDVKWYVAYNIASSVFDDDVKDLARTLIGGGLPGIENKGDVQVWINDLYPFITSCSELDCHDREWLKLVEVDFFTTMLTFYKKQSRGMY